MKYIGREMALARASRHAGLGAARRVGYVRGRSSLKTWAVECEFGIEETCAMASGLGAVRDGRRCRSEGNVDRPRRCDPRGVRAREVYSTITGNGYSP